MRHGTDQRRRIISLSAVIGAACAGLIYVALSINDHAGQKLAAISSDETSIRSVPRRADRSRIRQPAPAPPAGTGAADPARRASAITPAARSWKAAQEINPDLIPNEYILSFDDLDSRDAFIERARARGAKLLDMMDLGCSARLSVDPAMLRGLIAEWPGRVRHSPNYYVIAPDPAGGAENAASSGYTAFGDRALAWLGVPGNPSDWGHGITVAVLDTAVKSDAGLPRDRLVRVRMSGGMDVEGTTLDGHGTAVSSLIVGTRNGTAGIAPGCAILNVEVLSPEGVGDAFTLAKGIMEAVNRGADIINCCVGTYGECRVLELAVDAAAEKGIPIVAAAGNDSAVAVCYPARYDSVIGVSAVDAGGRLLPFSNRGAGIDIAAPGLGVNAAWIGETEVLFSGTSAAAPFVSGTLAAIMSRQKGVSGPEAVRILRQYCNDAGEMGPDESYGAGILDVGRIMDRGTQGIYDAAVGGMSLRKDGPDGKPELQVYLQNRGTETLVNARLEISINDRQQTVYLRNIEPCMSRGGTAQIDPDVYVNEPWIRIQCRAAIDNVRDFRPENDARSAVIFVADDR